MSACIRISLHDARFHARHGLFPQERVVGNEFAVDLTVTIPADDSLPLARSVSDRIEGTISYADLHSMVKEHMETPCNLLEHLAAGIVDAIAMRWEEVREIDIRVKKLAPPIPASDCSAAVSIYWSRN